MMNRTATCFVLAALVFNTGALRAADFTPAFGSEDDNLQPLPPAALAAVRAHAATTDYRDCAAGGFIGAAVDLAGQHRPRDWIAKTADGCAWGAASVVIWVLKHEDHGYRVVLFGSGQAVNLERAKPGAVADLQFIDATAGHYAETIYRYDGKAYRELRSRLVDLSDPADCKRNPDVCDAH